MHRETQQSARVEKVGGGNSRVYINGVSEEEEKQSTAT
jgi:hypothetical protein